MEFTWSGKALVVTLFCRLLFGGYLIGMDQYRFNDVESAQLGVISYIILFLTGILGLIGTLARWRYADQY